MRVRITSGRRDGGAAPDELAAADSEWEDAGIVIAAAGAEVARLGGGFRRRDDRKPLIYVEQF